nr:hypothetical protein [bacterium]
MKLGEVLKDRGLITDERIEVAIAHQKITGNLLGETLINLGFVSSNEIARTLAEQAGIPFVDLAEHIISEEAIRLVPKDVAQKTGFIPLRIQEDGSIEIGITNPSNIHAIDMVLKLTGKRPMVFMIDNQAFHESIERAYFFLENPIQQRINEAIDEIKIAQVLPAATVAALSENLIMEGIRRKATDVHISPEAETVNVFYRVDG